VAHGFQSALSGSRFYQAPGFAGGKVTMAGNIDKRALIKGPEAIKEEVMSKVPFLLEKGGFFPSVDHLVPPDVTFENFCYFINLLREIGGLEKLKF